MAARKSLTIFACALALALPPLNAVAATRQKESRTKADASVKTQTVLGSEVVCNKSNQTAVWSEKAYGSTAWGPLQLKLTFQKKKGGALKFIAITWPIWPQHTSRSIFINEKALPLLAQQVIELQSANIETISGATNVSLSFKKSLAAAMLAAQNA